MNLFQMIDMNLTSAEEVRISIRKAGKGVLCVEMSVVQTEGTQEIVAMNTHRSTPEQMESSSCWDDMHLMLILANEAIRLDRGTDDEELYLLKLERARYLGQLESQAAKAAIEGHYGLADKLYLEAELYASGEDRERVKESRHRCIQMSLR